jgi:CheY-like chemotaxis protein
MFSAEPNRPKATILVVDDSPAMVRYLRTMLELDCYEVESASNGLEAVEKLRSGFDPELVLLDLQMPGMDGLQTLRSLLKLRPHLKVLMCSGVDDPRKMHRAVALGAKDYLTKPIHHLYLSAAVERCLNSNGQGSRTTTEAEVTV